jgi:hypothetical protein
MENNTERLYNLLPVIYRRRDAEAGYPLKALLEVIAEQVNLVEDDIDQLYENWFIETCQDWVVPYIGDLVGYRQVHEAGEPGPIITPQGRLRNKILIPRREVANTVHYRRRKGALALLEILANDVSGWPARAVEFRRLISFSQPLNHQRLELGRTVDLRKIDALDRLNGPFDELAHTVDVRRVSSHRSQGRYNIPSVGVFVWPIKTFSVTRTPACCPEKDKRPYCFTFSVLGNDCPLFTLPQPEIEPTHIAEEINLPIPIRRLAFQNNKADYYGEGKSLQIWYGNMKRPVHIKEILVTDLSHWETYRPRKDIVAVDPVLGRIALSPRQIPQNGITVSYHYGFSAEIGGGEYERTISQPEGASLYRVGRKEENRSINDALSRWIDDSKKDLVKDAVIEITDSDVYEPEEDGVEVKKKIDIVLKEGQSLQIRAANFTRPIIRLLDYSVRSMDYLTVKGDLNTRFTLDGLLVTNHGIKIEGDLDQINIRHCTLVPGLAPLELVNLNHARVAIDRSIIGPIHVNQDELMADPMPISISDSIVDGTSPENIAVDAPTELLAHATLTILRSTVFGKVLIHSIKLAENCIFNEQIGVGRSQFGCIRFCYVTPDSRTPRRFCCQPDLAMKASENGLREDLGAGREPTNGEIETVRQAACGSMRPMFSSRLYGTPHYCRLDESCAEEIKRGAEDESEMGVFHDLYQPQRAANLRARLEEYTPAGMDAGVIFADIQPRRRA